MTREQGAASTLAVVLVGLILTVSVVSAGVSAIIGAHRVAQAAADLSALAAASELQIGSATQACARADEVAQRNHARLVACRVSGAEVVVTVTTTTAPLLGERHAMRARARAGPARS